jgi:hypothetical protein
MADYQLQTIRPCHGALGLIVGFFFGQFSEILKRSKRSEPAVSFPELRNRKPESTRPFRPACGSRREEALINPFTAMLDLGAYDCGAGKRS